MSIPVHRPILVVACAALLVASACVGPPDDQATRTVDPATAGRVDIDETTLAQLDSGNAAYRARDLDAALRHYTVVTERAPDAAAGWFGIYMIQSERGDAAAASAALDRARDAAPGASLIRDTLPDDGGGA